VDKKKEERLWKRKRGRWRGRKYRKGRRGKDLIRKGEGGIWNERRRMEGQKVVL
jgi:hypothetical protein